MRRPIVITGLDIGSSKIAAVCVEIDGSGAFNIIGHVTEESKGVSRGVIENLNGVTSSVSKVMGRLRSKISKNPGSVYVNVSGETVKGMASKGMIPLALRGREITKIDMARCVNAASTINLAFDREIVHKIVRAFSIDDHEWIKNPLGLYASRLNCEVYIITADANQMENITKCVNEAGYDVKEIIFTGMADGASLLTDAEKESGVILADIGASLAQLSIFFERVLLDLDIIPIGSGDIKGDFHDSLEFNSLLARMNSKIEDLLKRNGKISSIVLTGGLAFADGVVEFMEGKLMYPIRMGIVKNVRGEISGLDSLRLSTAIGLCKYGYEKYSKKSPEEKDPLKRISAKVVDIFNNYF